MGTRFVFASDEFYVLAEREVPDEEAYEGFDQIENGVGLIRNFQTEVEEELEQLDDDLVLNKRYIIPTGTLAFEFMDKISKLVMKKIKGLDIKVIPIKNKFFGETITVAGLLTASDIIEQIEGEDLGDGLLITKAMLKADEDIFLDNITLEELEETLKTDIIVTKVDGHNFIEVFTNNMR